MMNLIEKFDYKLEQASLLTHPDFISWKKVETATDMLQIRVGLKLSIHVALFSFEDAMSIEK